MNKNTVLALVIGLLIGGAVSYSFTSAHWTSGSSSSSGDLTGQIVLVRKADNSTAVETGLRVPYDISGTYPGVSVAILSPDKTKVLYTTRENAKIVLYVSTVDGSNAKQIAQQEVPEGSGELDTSTIKWSTDGKNVTYTEVGMKCIGTCVSPNDFTRTQTNYSIDVQSGTKTIVSTSLSIQPLLRREDLKNLEA